MQKLPSQNSDEALQEIMLRETLQQKALLSVDVEDGWKKISSHLDFSSSEKNLVCESKILSLKPLPHHSGEKPFLGRWQILVAVAALLIAFFGGSVVGNLSDGGKSNQAYAQVNQSREDQGVTITLLSGYASPQGTLLVVKTQLETLAGGAPSVIDFTLKYQQDVLTRGNGLGGGDARNNFSCDALWASGAHPPENVQTIDLTFHATKIAYVVGFKKPPKMIQGDWTFQFTLPFHHDNSVPSRVVDGDGPC